MQGRFDPRVVLKDVLEYALDKHRDSLAEGVFPSERFAEHFKNLDAPELDALVEQDIEAHDPATAARRKVLLTFWGDAPRTLVDLHPSIHGAFDISLSGVNGGDPPVPKPLPPISPPSPPVSPSPKPDNKLAQDLLDFAKWRKGAFLPQTLERRLRGLVHGSVVAHMDWERLVLVPKNWTGGGKAFSTDRILFHDKQHRNPGFVFLTVDRESASDAAAIEALLRYEQHGSWSFENGARFFRNLRIALDRWGGDVRAQLETIQEADRVAFENAIHALVLGAIACGLVDARTASVLELIDAIFESIPESPSHAEGPWEELQLACARGGGGRRDSREALQVRVTEFAGTSKGGRGPQMVDAATILPVLLARVDDLETTPGTSGSDGASQHLKHVLELLPEAVAARREFLKEWRDAISVWCDPGRFDAECAVQAVLATVDQARASEVSVQPYNAPHLLQRAGAQFVSHHPPDLWREVAAGLRDFDTLSAKDRIAFLAQQSEEALLDIRRFVDLSDRIVGYLEKRVIKECGGSTGLRNEVESAIERLHREFESTGAALKALAKIDTGYSE